MSKEKPTTTLGVITSKGGLNARVNTCPDLEHLAELAVRVRAGDPAAADALYHSLVRGVRLLARRRAGAANADDVVQDVFAALFDVLRSGKLDNSRAIIGYTWRIARNICCDYVRGIARDRLSVSTQDVPLISPITTDTAYLVTEQRARVGAALDRLDPTEREVLKRFYFDEQPPAEIRRMMGLSEQRYRELKNSATARLVRFATIPALRTTHVRHTPRHPKVCRIPRVLTSAKNTVPVQPLLAEAKAEAK